MRFRGVRYWWAGIGLVVLILLYALPIAAVFRQPTIPARTLPLPVLSLPSVGFPLLRVPKVHRLAALPAVPHSTHAAQRTAGAAVPHAAQKISRQRVPVVSDSHSQVTPQTAAQKAAPKDPFAEAPVVVDTIGAPIELPATASAASAPADTPNAAPSGDGPAVAEAGDAVPPPSQTDAKGGLSWFSVNGDQTGSASTATAETNVVGTGSERRKKEPERPSIREGTALTLRPVVTLGLRPMEASPSGDLRRA